MRAIHFAVGQPVNPACNCWRTSGITTSSRRSLVTCKSCKRTVAYRKSAP